MKILLLGYGKMGKTIEKLAMARNHEIYKVDTVEERNDLSNISEIEVAIEFSQPDAAVDNIKFCLDHNIPVLSGTTGWLEQKKDIDQYCLNKKGTFFYASNYSVGVNIFFRLNSWFAKVMNGFEGYEVSLTEIHHVEKKDAPSGTAITIAETIGESLMRKDGWGLDTPDEKKINIHSIRENDAPGTHVVKYSSSIDTIELSHTAHSREGFAMGALLVAEWLPEKNGILNMGNFLTTILS